MIVWVTLVGVVSPQAFETFEDENGLESLELIMESYLP